MCKYDKYDIINYQSDNALSLFNYIVRNGYEKDRCINVFISDLTNYDRLKKYIFEQLGDYKINLIVYFNETHKSWFKKLIAENNACKALSNSEYIISSTTYYYLENLICKQKFIDLSYYSAPFKNDLLSHESSIYMGLDKIGRTVHRYISPSEISTRLIFPTMSIPYHKYVTLGMCRNDNLIREQDLRFVKEFVLDKIDYHVSKIVLYIPTHKDYEQNCNSYIRSILGFNVDIQKFNLFCRQEGILIVCKVHPKQNTLVFNKSLPECIKVHAGNENFGLTELMKISDALMTDYTSGYFDYLLLDKPVIFNFYDYEIYLKTRGFTFDPIESIIAGEIVNDEESLYCALMNLDINSKIYSDKRHFLRDLFFKYQDTHSCKRAYNYIFNS